MKPGNQVITPREQADAEVATGMSGGAADPTRGAHPVQPFKPISKRTGLSPLQRHAGFFDRDLSGSVTPKDTFRGLRSLGVRPVLAGALTLLINAFLGYLTHRHLSPNVSVRDIARGVHPFDTGVFDNRGNLNETRFEDLFQPPNARAPFDRLTAAEIRGVMLRRGDPHKPFGEIGSILSSWFAARELQLLFCLASDATKPIAGSSEEEPAISRRTLRRFYEGRLFFILERRKRIHRTLRRE